MLTTTKWTRWHSISFFCPACLYVRAQCSWQTFYPTSYPTRFSYPHTAGLNLTHLPSPALSFSSLRNPSQSTNQLTVDDDDLITFRHKKKNEKKSRTRACIVWYWVARRKTLLEDLLCFCFRIPTSPYLLVVSRVKLSFAVFLKRTLHQFLRASWTTFVLFSK